MVLKRPDAGIPCDCGRNCKCVSCVICRRDNRSPLSSDKEVLSALAVAVSNERLKLEKAVIAAFTRFFPEQPNVKFNLQGDEELSPAPQPLRDEPLEAYRGRVDAYLTDCARALLGQRVDEATEDKRMSDGLTKNEERTYRTQQQRLLNPPIQALLKRFRTELDHVWNTFEGQMRRGLPNTVNVTTVIGELTIAWQGNRWVVLSPRDKQYPTEEPPKGGGLFRRR